MARTLGTVNDPMGGMGGLDGIADVVRELRIRGMSLREIAKGVGVSTASVAWGLR